MKRGPIIHGVLLVAALLFAYQTWTREEEVAPITGNVVLWDMPASAITAVTFDTMSEVDGRTVRIERKSDRQGSYLWGYETRKRKEYPDYRPDLYDGGVVPPESIKPSWKDRVSEFAVGTKGEEMMAGMAQMRALRDMGVISDEQKKRYELDKSTESIAVFYQGGTRKLIIGSKVFGSADRYALDPDTGRGYVIVNAAISDLMGGETSLRMTDLHAFEEDQVGKAVLKVGDRVRNLVQITVADAQGFSVTTWADAATPTKPDQTMANFLQSISLLKPAMYEPETPMDQLKLVVRVEYQRANGAPLGWIELYEGPPRPPDEYYEEEASAPAGGAAADKQAQATPTAQDKQPQPTPGKQSQPAPGKQAQAVADKNKPGQNPAGAKQAAAGKEAPASQEANQEAGEKADQEANQEANQEAKKKAPKPRYFIRTELTRVVASVPYNIATRVTEDISQIFK